MEKGPALPRYRNLEERRNGWRSSGNTEAGELLAFHHGVPNFIINSKTKEQIDLDVARSFTQFHLEEPKLQQRRDELRLLLYSIFFYHPDLHYYQGFNDLCSIFLLTLGLKDAALTINSAIKSHLRDLLNRADFGLPLALVDLAFGVLKVVDPLLYEKLLGFAIPPYFCISWIITWFAHDICHLRSAQVCFDFLLANEPIAIIYATAALPTLFRQRLLAWQDMDDPSIHQFLKNLPKEMAPSLLVTQAARLMKMHPAASLLRIPAPMVLLESLYIPGGTLMAPQKVERRASFNWPQSSQTVMLLSVVVVLLAIYQSGSFWDGFLD